MVKFQVRRDASAAVGYFLHDSQLSEEERRGIWVGSACAHASLKQGQVVTASDLESVLNGRGPAGDRLFMARKPNRRIAWDGVITPHKSISVAALCLAEQISRRVRDAFHSAVSRVLGHMESLAYRQAPRSGDPFVPTGNLLAAQFVHQASRHADPHLHAHLLIVNASYCSDRRWRSLEPSPLYKHQTALKLIFNTLLHHELVSRGFRAVRDATDGLAKLPVPKVICDAYSKAHNAIIGMAHSILEAGMIHPEWLNLPKAALVNRLNERTRPKHRPEKPDWQALLSDAEKRHVEALILAPVDHASAPAFPPVLDPRTSPLTILRERWEQSAVRQSLKKIVAQAAADFPGVPLGEFASASIHLRSEFPDTPDDGSGEDFEDAASHTFAVQTPPQSREQAAANLRQNVRKAAARRKRKAPQKPQH